jgi:RNA polymerase sigma-70 factor (ECF subfamily)
MSKPDPEPHELLLAAKSGDTAALGQLLVLYHDYLALLAKLQIGRRLQRKVDASDIVQEVHLKAYRDFGSFRGITEAELIGWLRQILAMSIAGMVRKYFGTQRRDLMLEKELEMELDRSSCALGLGPLVAHSTPSHHAMRREQAVVLANALRRLPEHYQDVIILHHLEGLTLSEVGHRLGRTEDSVSKLWARALIQIRRQLEVHNAPSD